MILKSRKLRISYGVSGLVSYGDFLWRFLTVSPVWALAVRSLGLGLLSITGVKSGQSGDVLTEVGIPRLVCDTQVRVAIYRSSYILRHALASH